jgi:hypothetical protein
MAITFVNPNNAAGQNNGATTPANTVSITPTLPSGSASGDRIYVVQCASNTSATAPANWTVVGSKDTVIASALGAVAASAGQRYMSVYYRDYDGSWSMPAFTLTSATQNSHWIGAVAIRKTSSNYTWNTPTISSVADDTGTANTAHSATTGSSFTTTAGGFLIIGQVNNDNVTSTAQALSQSGATFGTVTERADGGTATGNDVSGNVATCLVTTGAAATVTATATLSAASQGGNLIVQQTETAPPAGTPPSFASSGNGTGGTGVSLSIAVPSGVSENDIILVPVWIDDLGTGVETTVTPPSGFSTAGSDGVSDTVTSPGYIRLKVFYKRQTSATGAGETTGSYTFTLGNTVDYRTGFALRFTECITSGNPLNVTTKGDHTGDSNAGPVAVSMTTTVANTLLVWIATNWDANIADVPAGYTSALSNSTDNGWRAATLVQATAGATGTITSATTATSAWNTWFGALKPTPAAAAAVPKPANINQSVNRAATY